MSFGRGTRARGAVLIIGALACALVFVPQAAAVDFAADAPSLGPIPDGQAGCAGDGGPLDVTFNTFGLTGPPGDVAVTFTLSPAHTFVGDLDVTLIGPGGARQTIFSGTGVTPGSTGGDGSDVAGPYTFSDRATNSPSGGWWQAAAATSDSAAVPAGTYRTTAPGTTTRPGPAAVTSLTAAFANVPTSNGGWTLRFRDLCANDVWEVQSATLSLGQTFAVTNTNDSGAGSLRSALDNANANADLDAIDATGVAGTINLASVLPAIITPMTIHGPGAGQLTVRRDTGGNYRVFAVGSGGDATISGLTLTNGNSASAPGGGVQVLGALTLDHVVVRDNTTAATGGGVSALASSARLTVIDSTISGNTAGNGGGIAFGNGDITVERSTISGNHATNVGGGLEGQLSGTTVLRSSTVTRNFADASGNAVLLTAGSNLYVENSTIADNPGSPGSGPPVFTSATGFITFESTILEDAAETPVCSGGNVTSLGYNVASDASCALTQSTDQQAIDPQLGPLADNGGPTLTLAPAASSPAIDKGTVNSVTVDQRGFERPIDMPMIANPSGGLAADAGAVEVRTNEVSAPAVSVTGGPTTAVPNTQPTFSFNAQNAQQIQCSIDHGTPSYGTCSTAASHTPSAPLADGTYTFHVRATTITGTEADDSRTFTVDTTPPSVTVDSGPNGPTLDETPTFSFSAGEPATFACRLGTGEFGACTGPGQTFSPAGLKDGAYTFEVRATDAAGNQSTASRSFTLTAAACRLALSNVIKANGVYVTAQGKLAKAQQSGSKAKIKKAKKAVKKAKKSLKDAKKAVSLNCVA